MSAHDERRGSWPRLRGVAVAMSAGLAVHGCVDRGAGSRADDPALVAKNLLREVPATLTPRLDVAFSSSFSAVSSADVPSASAAPPTGAVDGAKDAAGVSVVYLGNLVDHEALVPGDTVEIRHFWRVLAPPPPDLRVVTYLRGQEGGADFMNLDDSPMRRAHPPSSWKAGEIIQDTQSVRLRPQWRSSTASLYVGLMRRGGHRAADRLPVRAGGATENLALARQWTVDLSKAPPPPGTVVVRKATSAITIDGVGDEPAWQQVPWSAEFPTAEGSPDPVGKAEGKLTWDDQALYLFVHVEDSDVASPYRKRDDPLWKADCIELFIDADGNREQYVELQVNPFNAVFDSYFATTRAQPGDVGFDAGLRSQVVVHGTRRPERRHRHRLGPGAGGSLAGGQGVGSDDGGAVAARAGRPLSPQRRASGQARHREEPRGFRRGTASPTRIFMRSTAC